MMNKIVDGVELLRMIRDGEIKHKTEILDIEEKYEYTYDEYLEDFFGENQERLLENYYTLDLAKTKFEILSQEDKEIDIDSIEELNTLIETNSEKIEANTVRKKINELIKAIKQLNKKIGEK